MAKQIPPSLTAAIVLLLACGCQTTEFPQRDYRLSGGTEPSHAISDTGLDNKRDEPAEPRAEDDEDVQLALPKQYAVRPARYQPKPGNHPAAEEPGRPESADPEAEEIAESDLQLSDLEAIALQSNPALGQARARVASAQGNWLQVGLPPNPRIGYAGNEMGDDGTAGQQGGFVRQQFITGQKLRLNRRVAAWEVQRAKRDLDAIRLRVLTDVRIGYYDVLIAQRRRELASDLVRVSEQGAKAAKALFDGKEVSEADPLRARVDADTARIVLQNSVNQHLEAWRRLVAVLGSPDLPIQRLQGELRPGDLDFSWQETLARVLRESPEMAAALADVEAAQWAVERAYAEVVPDINVQAGVAKDNSTQDTIASVQVQVPIPIINRNQGGIRRAYADASAAARAVDRLALDLQARLASAFQRYESARNQVEQYSRDGGILDKSKRTLELVRRGYQAGEFGVLDLLSAQRTYFQTNLAYLDSLRELWVSVIEIRGLLLRGSLPKD